MAKICSLRLLVCLIYFIAFGAAQGGVCEKVVIAGEPDWPPFSYMKDGRMTGVGFDLAKKLFAELDLEVEVREVKTLADLAHWLRRGRVDLLVATYDMQRYRDLVHLMTPGYFEDATSILVLKDSPMEYWEWYDLMGYYGNTSYNGQIGEEFLDFSKKYLNIQARGSLEGLFKRLDNRLIDYVIGSTEFLKYGMALYDEDDKFEFLPQFVHTEEVFFGFAKGSDCLQYAPFFKARMAELLGEDDMVEKILLKHMPEQMLDQMSVS